MEFLKLLLINIILFRHIHDRSHRRRDMVKCYNQREETRRRDHVTGLNTLRHTIAQVHNLTMDGTAVTVANVQLECDITQTPWCDCEGAPKDALPVNNSSKAGKSKKVKKQ